MKIIKKNRTLKFKKKRRKKDGKVDNNSETIASNCFLIYFWKLVAYNVSWLVFRWQFQHKAFTKIH